VNSGSISNCLPGSRTFVGSLYTEGYGLTFSTGVVNKRTDLDTNRQSTCVHDPRVIHLRDSRNPDIACFDRILSSQPTKILGLSQHIQKHEDKSHRQQGNDESKL